MKYRIDEGDSSVQTLIHHHTDGMGNDQVTIEHREDVQPVLDSNLAAARAASERSSAKYSGDHAMHEIAEIPMSVFLTWLNEGLNILDGKPETRRELRRRLDDPDYRYLRTGGGRLGQRHLR
jgi:hypothetical protein